MHAPTSTLSRCLRVGGAALSFCLGLTLNARAQSAAPPWLSARIISTTNASPYYSVSDAAGNVYVAGMFSSQTTIGGITLTSQGFQDGFLAKFSPGGALQWLRLLASPGSENISALRLDSQGNPYVCGASTAVVDLGNNQVLPHPYNNGSLGFVARYSPAGVPEWTRQVTQGTSSSLADISDIGFDAAGNLLLMGDYRGEIRLGSSTLSSSIVPSELPVYLARISGATGAVQLLTHALTLTSTTNSFTLPRLTVAPSGEVYLLTNFNSPITLNTGAVVSARGATDGLLTRFSSTGALQWQKQIGGSGPDEAAKAQVDAAGTLYLVGSYSGSVSFDNTTLQSAGPNPNGFIVTYSAAGAQQWVQSVGSTGTQYLRDIVLDKAGNCFVLGSFTGQTRVGTTLLTSLGGSDIAVASYSPQGQLRWVQQAGGVAHDYPWALYLDPAEDLFLLGQYKTSITLGSLTLNATTFGYESFLARLGSSPLAVTPARRPQALNVYPNPARTRVQVPGLPVGSPLQLLDAQGRVVRSCPVAATADVSVQGLAPGLYLLRATNAQGQPVGARLVVE